MVVDAQAFPGREPRSPFMPTPPMAHRTRPIQDPPREDTGGAFPPRLARLIATAGDPDTLHPCGPPLKPARAAALRSSIRELVQEPMNP